jgi:hypothetical protein
MGKSYEPIGLSAMDDKTATRPSFLQHHPIADHLVELRDILRLNLMSLRVDMKPGQSYLTSRLKEVQIGHENHA